MARRVPTGAKHQQCTQHVPHEYTKSGYLCIVNEEPAEVVSLADYLSEQVARKRAEWQSLMALGTRQWRAAVRRMNGTTKVKATKVREQPSYQPFTRPSQSKQWAIK